MIIDIALVCIIIAIWIAGWIISSYIFPDPEWLYIELAIMRYKLLMEKYKKNQVVRK